MQNDIPGDLSVPQPQPLPCLLALQQALPLTHFLVAFARREVGRFKERHQREIVSAHMHWLDNPNVSAVDVEWWITEGMPKAGEIYSPIEELAQRLIPSQRSIARRAAINIVGPSGSDNRLRCHALIDQLFPTVAGPNGLQVL